MASLTLTGKDVADLKGDALVIAVAAAGDRDGVATVLAPAQLSKSTQAALQDLVVPMGLTGRADEVVRVPSPKGVSTSVVVFTGVGKLGKDGIADETLRRAAGAASRSMNGLKKAVFALPTATVNAVAAVSEGALMGAYTYVEFFSNAPKSKSAPLAEVEVATDLAKKDAAKAAAREAEILAKHIHGVRDLVNCPPSDLYPETFAARAEALAKKTNVSVEILDDKTLAKQGYGGLTGVGMGSDRGPRLVKLTYKPKGAKRHVALVGKGVTFDTGGISLKPSAGMEAMKSDMAGAAATLHTILTAAELDLPVRITAYLCLAENMPSHLAQRPSDVIRIYGGKTVEVLNTDAEGRLILADAIVAASEENPDMILDIATLTGAQGVALGTRMSAVMGDDDTRQLVKDAADACGEMFWPMPMPAELRPKMDSPVADIANIGDRFGGMLSAALFLQEFVGKVGGKDAKDDAPRIPWAHLDIAFPAITDKPGHGYCTPGGTGVGVRTMLTVLKGQAK